MKYEITNGESAKAAKWHTQIGCVLKMMRPFRQTHAHVLLITQERSETVVMSPDSRNIFNGPRAWCFFKRN